MTTSIELATKMKEELEERMLHDLQLFSKVTGLSVYSIDLNRIVSYPLSQRNPAIVLANVRLDVRLP